MAEPSPAVDSRIPGTAGLGARTRWTLLAGNAVTSVGVSFFLPILPLFVRSRGGGALLVGIIFAAGITGRMLVQYPAGWLADHWGRRPVMVAAITAYALLFPLYLLPARPEALILLRFVHAIAGGAFLPAAAALVGDLAAEERRGHAYGQLRASDMAGMTLGPALGGLVAGFRLEAVFLAGAGISLAAAALLTRLPGGRPVPRLSGPGAAAPKGPSPARLLWLLLPVAALGMPVYWTFGTYDSVWSLYLSSRGAGPFLVGLSFAVYALPIVFFAGLAGGLADRLGAVWAATVALLTHGLLALAYPLVASVPVLIGIGFGEGTLTSIGTPALQAEASRSAPPGAQGRTQGVYSTALAVAESLGAVAGGALYTLRPLYAFAGVTAVCVAGGTVSLALRRSRAGAHA